MGRRVDDRIGAACSAVAAERKRREHLLGVSCGWGVDGWTRGGGGLGTEMRLAGGVGVGVGGFDVWIEGGRAWGVGGSEAVLVGGWGGGLRIVEGLARVASIEVVCGRVWGGGGSVFVGLALKGRLAEGLETTAGECNSLGDGVGSEACGFFEGGVLECAWCARECG
ncbi:hypothetical protein Tco_0597899 [Tanacetum coccineum]